MDDETTGTEQAAETTEGFQLPDPLPATVAELNDLLEDARSAFEDVHAASTTDGGVPSEDDVAELERIATAIETVEGAVVEVEQGEADRVARATAVAERVSKPAEDKDGDDGDEPAEQPAEDKEAESVSASSRRSGGATARSRAQTGAPRRTFAGAARGRGNAGQLPAEKKGDRGGFFLRDGDGSKIDSAQFANAFEANIGRPGKTIGMYDRDFPAELTADDSKSLTAALKVATDESRLPGGSLLAAGGWCSPSEVMYDFLDVPPAEDLVDLPEIVMTRAGVQFPVEPDFSAIYDATGFFQTEAQLIADNVEKPCFEVPCVGFREVRMDAIGLCITSGLIQNRGYPELVRRYIDGALLAHKHKISKRTMDKIVAGSTSHQIPAGSVIGAVGALLNSVELALMDLRVKHRDKRAMDLYMPVWAAALIRSDLAYRQNVETAAITDAQITAWFTARNTRVQWIVDWQTGGTGEFGGTTVPLTWPTAVKFVIHPVGTFFRSLNSIIELGTVYDAAMLKRNKAVQLFTEDGLAIGKRGVESRLYTVPVDVNGAVGAREAFTQATV